MSYKVILRFNRELLQDNIPHTQEDFIETLSEIDFYERYCKEHPEYENNRAVLAIQNIERVYSEMLEKHNFVDIGGFHFYLLLWLYTYNIIDNNFTTNQCSCK